MLTRSTPSRLLERALFASLLLFFHASSNAAPGLGIAWNACAGDVGSAQNAVFACDTNSGSHTFYGSFQLTKAMPIVIGHEMMVDLASASPALPAWWGFKNAGTCRLSSLSMLTVSDLVDPACPDWGQGLQMGGIGGYCTQTAPCGAAQQANTVRLKMIVAVAPLDAQDLLGAQDYFAFGVRIDHQKTVGTGACGGCDTPVCIVFNSINVVARDNVENRFISNPMAPGANFIAWQGGGNPVVGTATGCPAATAARSSTWGAIKTLYR